MATDSKSAEVSHGSSDIDNESAKPSAALSQIVLEGATDGNEEQQLVVGKHYLSLAETEIKPEENGKLAVDWLIKTSKQGNEEATTLLSRCLENKIGLHENVLPDMAWCIKTSAIEKKVRHAAHNLFWKIDKKRKGVLTKEEYLLAVKDFAKTSLEKSLLASAAKKLGNNITETGFVKAVSKQVQGKVIPTTEETTEKEAAFESAGTFQKVIKYPRQTLMVAVNQGLELASNEGSSWIISLIPVNQIQIMLLLFAYNFLTPSFLFLVVPLFCFYLSLLGMFLSTLQMIYGKKKMSNVTTWANMMKEHNVGIDIDMAQSQFMWNSLTPYLVYFSSLFFTVTSFSLAEKSYIPCSEICIMAGLFSIFCFVGLSDSYDFLLIISVVCNFLATLPTFMAGFPYIPVFTWLQSFLTSPLTYVDLGPLFRVNIGLPSVSYVIIPLFFIRMATMKSWQGTYRILVPHLVCYFWWNFMSSVFPFTTWIGLARASLGYAVMPVLLPVMIFGGLLYGFYSVFIVMKSDLVGKVIVTVLLAAIPILLTRSKKIFGAKFEAKYGKAKKCIMLGFAILSIIPLAFIQLPTMKAEERVPLSWESYAKHCGNLLPNSNTAGTQMKCSHLVGVKVNWSGTVRYVKITKVENGVEKFLNGLPSIFADHLRCVYGQPYPECDEEIMSGADFDSCNLWRTQKNKCHLKEHDEYSFQISLTLSTGEGDQYSLALNADHKFKETILALESDDAVEFTAVLKDGLGTGAPQLSLRQLACTNRELLIMQVVDDELEDFYEKKVNEVITVAIHFVWYPLLEYTP